MRKKWGKRLLGALFYLALLALTLWYVFQDENLSQVAQYLSEARPADVALAVAAVVAFILGEAVVLRHLLGSLGTKSRFSHCCLFSFIGFFYSAITPSASGGQPMQVVYMRRDGIPGAVATVVLAIVTITYKLVLVAIGAAVLIFQPPVIMERLAEVRLLIYLGMGLNVIAITLLLLAVFHPMLLERCAGWGIRVVNRIHPFRNPQRVMNRVQNNVAQYRGAADFFREKPGIILRIMGITLVQRLSLFSVVWFTYRALGLSGQSAVTLVLLNGMISVAVDMLPLPGGMGISETLFVTLFEPLFGAQFVLPGMILCRGISYYTQLLISGVMTIGAQLFFHRKEGN